jgi:hypothetical protein
MDVDWHWARMSERACCAGAGLSVKVKSDIHKQQMRQAWPVTASVPSHSEGGEFEPIDEGRYYPVLFKCVRYIWRCPLEKCTPPIFAAFLFTSFRPRQVSLVGLEEPS